MSIEVSSNNKIYIYMSSENPEGRANNCNDNPCL